MDFREFFSEIQKRGKPYTLVFLKEGSRRDQDEAATRQIQMEHVQYLLQLQEEGILAINGPLMDDSPVIGLSIYNTSDAEQVRNYVEADPGYLAGRFSYEIHPFFSLPGARLA